MAPTYDALEERGYLTAGQGAGSWVRARTSDTRAQTTGRLFSFTTAADGAVETQTDAVRLTEAAKRIGVKLAPGPGFSTYDAGGAFDTTLFSSA